MFGKLVLLLAAVTNARETRYLRGSPGLSNQTNTTLPKANYSTGLVPYMPVKKAHKYAMCTKAVALYSNKTVNSEL